MAMKKDYSPKDLMRLNVYQLKDKNQTVYYDRFTKTAYIITKQCLPQFSTWECRLPLCILLPCILIINKVNPALSIFLGVAIYVVTSILFRTKFLSTLPVNTSFVLPEKKSLKDTIINLQPPVLKAIALMFLCAGVFMIVNLIISNYNTTSTIICLIFIVICIVCGVAVFMVYKKACKLK